MIAFAYFFIYWIISGVAALMIGWKHLHDPSYDNKTKEILSRFYFDLNIPAEDCRSALCLILLTGGFIFLPVMIINKIVKFFKKDRKNG